MPIEKRWTSLCHPLASADPDCSMSVLMSEKHPEYIFNADAGTTRVFSDMPQADALKAVRKMGPQSVCSFTEKTTFDAYRHVPVSYIVCEKDMVLPIDWQMAKVELMNSIKKGEKVDVLRFDAGHCPNVSDPEGCARLVVEAVERGMSA